MLKVKCIAIAAAAWGAWAIPACADDCAPVVAAMTASAKTPSSSTITETDARGNQTVSHAVHTETTHYVESNGKWLSMALSSQEVLDRMTEMLKTVKMTCQLAGAETVNGQATKVYIVHTGNEGTVSDNKIWVSLQNLQLKSENNVEGTKYSSVVDYSNVQPPAESTPMGKR
jgi:hypothetical protein